MSDAPAHKWAVTGQTEEATLDAEGNPTTLHHVTFMTDTGHESSVTIPDVHYSAENVAAAIHHKATEIRKVHSLHSDITPTPPGESA